MPGKGACVQWTAGLGHSEESLFTYVYVLYCEL